MNTTTDPIEAAKQLAKAEIEAHRDRKRREREAKARADETAEQEIQRSVLARREEEARQAETRAAMQAFWAKREADLAALAAAERAAGGRKLGPSVAPTPARRVARLLRQRLGADFDAFLTDIKACDFRQFQAEVARIPADELAERLHREGEARAAALAEAARTLPEPEEATETAILARHGLTAVRAAELDAGAL